MHIEENRPLAPFTTFGIGGPARWFAEAASEAEIAEAAAWARQRGVALFVLGGGSNLLVSDAGFNGLALHIGVKGIDQEGELFHAGAGESWEHFVERAIQAGCQGVECLAGIPGTVGGTPVQNVGAYGQEVSSVIERVRAFDLAEHGFVEFTAAECGFSYRRSRFNSTDRGRYIVTRVDYRLRRDGEPQLTYADLKQHFDTRQRVDTRQPIQGRPDQPSLAEVAAAVCAIRQSKGMVLVEGDPDCRSAGSFFKNPSVSSEAAERIKTMAAGSCASLRVYPGPGGLVKIPAAWLIEQAGFPKGYALGEAAISSKHMLALINRGGATAAEILALADQIRAAVEHRFSIRLQMEPVMVGFQS